jgi:hypothetical protein
MRPRPRATGPPGSCPAHGREFRGGADRPARHRADRDLRRPVLRPLLAGHPRDDVSVREIANDFFGGNIGVAGSSPVRTWPGLWGRAHRDTRYLLPDACLNEGRFLDGLTLADLPRPVEVVPTDGSSLRRRSTAPRFDRLCAA